jgi:LETM1 and EF-hand domain-containing protein 1
MLPSTFKEADKEVKIELNRISLLFFLFQQQKLKKQLKAKLEVAKFLQDTLEDTALKSNKKRSDDALTEQFATFMHKVYFFLSLIIKLFL